MSSGNKKSLVIVESPAKARTISKFLGPSYQVEASIGHIRDLPSGAKEVPERYKREPWAYLGVNVEDHFTPIYIVPPEKKKQVSKLQAAVKEADTLYLATDEDREGEAISWHLLEVLKPKVPVKRLVFHEITREAIQHALSNTRDIDEGLVRAQETRRILDRLYGYDVSQLLWKKVRPKLSAGRVQSVAVRLIVDRERERMAFVSSSYHDLLGRFLNREGSGFEARLIEVDGRRIPSGKDFDPATGRLRDAGLLQMNAEQAAALLQRLQRADFKVRSVEVKPFTERPKPPFTTSTLQQEANRKLGFTARRTMQVAQTLYENGYITYMRTDSTNLAQVAIAAARGLVASQYGERFLHETPRTYSTKVKNAQEAHEAIRPAGQDFRLPESLRGELDRDQQRLYDMIWKRTIASQMADAKKRRVTVVIEGDGALFQASGTSIEFEGFLRAYVEGSDDPELELAQQERLLPNLQQHDPLDCQQLEVIDHTTQPPARYTEASLTRTLEEKGIGRPSTYASIIDTIQNREYVFKKGNALVPSWTAFAVIRLMEEHLGGLVNYAFTADMEDFLDAISRNEGDALQYLNEFYLGESLPDAVTSVAPTAAKPTTGLRQLLKNKAEQIDPRQACQYELGPTVGGAAGESAAGTGDNRDAAPQVATVAGAVDGSAREPIYVRVGRYGPFLQQGELRAGIPDGLPPDELSYTKAIDLLTSAAQAEEPLGHDPASGKPIFVRQGRFGPFVQLGTNDDDEKKYASLLKGMEPEQVSLQTALDLLSLPRTLGDDPNSSEPVIASNGRYGPYVKCGSQTRSLPAELSVLDVSLDQALALLAQPKVGRGRQAAAPKEPIKTFEASPVTGQPVKLLDGRYGPYVTDGETNASLPKGATAEALTLEEALQLLADRAAAGGTKKKKAKKGTTTATKKGTAASRASKKAAPKKSSPRKASKKSS